MEAPSGEESPRSRLKILVVDDNVDLVRSQAQVLAISAGEASSVAERFQPDVVLLDLGQLVGGQVLQQRAVFNLPARRSIARPDPYRP
jgi:hypothetical protein